MMDWMHDIWGIGYGSALHWRRLDRVSMASHSSPESYCVDVSSCSIANQLIAAPCFNSSTRR
jgi:hypothetical protein